MKIITLKKYKSILSCKWLKNSLHEKTLVITVTYTCKGTSQTMSLTEVRFIVTHKYSRCTAMCSNILTLYLQQPEGTIEVENDKESPKTRQKIKATSNHHSIKGMKPH
jgi:hypothetical protein